MSEACTTERLRARRPAARDSKLYRDLLLDRRVGRWLRPPPLDPYTADEVAAIHTQDVAHWEEHAFGPWLLFERRGGAFVGRGGLRWTTVGGEHAVELPWALVPSRWGAGMASEAARAALRWARELRLAEVIAYAWVENTRSVEVMERAGLKRDREIEHRGLPHVLYRARLDAAGAG